MSKMEANEAKAEESEHESEDESETLEESPCGRWLKRNEEVSQRNVPGIDRAYLAMDSEEGVEVVWNEVQFSERKSYKAQETKIRTVFDNLTRIDHANIVKFHRYWIDSPKKDPQKTRVIFITEYMSSGSVKKFLNKTKEIHKYKSAKSWKRWCRQILSALSYLHSCDPPIVHGNLTCETIFIQHNGLLKIGSVAPDAIRNHVKTYREIHKNLHYFAPECTDTQGSGNITPAVDIYSFGICALEMALPKTHLVSEVNRRITLDDIERAVTLLDDSLQQNFIRLCMSKQPGERPSARELLLHPVLFEVHSLKLLSAHAFVKNQDIFPENQMDLYKLKERSNSVLIAGKELTSVQLNHQPFDVDKFLEDVRNGIYPLTAFALPKPPRAQTRPQSPCESEAQLSGKGQGQGMTPKSQKEPVESRKIVHAQCCFLRRETAADADDGRHLIIQLRFDDKTNRQLRCDTLASDTPQSLAAELAQLNFIREADRQLLASVLDGRRHDQHEHSSEGGSNSIYPRKSNLSETGEYFATADHDHVIDDATSQHNNNNNNIVPAAAEAPEVFSIPSTPDIFTPPHAAPRSFPFADAADLVGGESAASS